MCSVASATRACSTRPRQGRAIEFVEAVRRREAPPAGAANARAPAPSRLTTSDVDVLLRKYNAGMESGADELASDFGAATASKAAAVTGSALSGTRSELRMLRGPAKSMRLDAHGVDFTTAAALRKTRMGIAVTLLLLAIGCGAVAASVLGADEPARAGACRCCA